MLPFPAGRWNLSRKIQDLPLETTSAQLPHRVAIFIAPLVISQIALLNSQYRHRRWSQKYASFLYHALRPGFILPTILVSRSKELEPVLNGFWSDSDIILIKSDYIYIYIYFLNFIFFFIFQKEIFNIKMVSSNSIKIHFDLILYLYVLLLLPVFIKSVSRLTAA